MEGAPNGFHAQMTWKLLLRNSSLLAAMPILSPGEVEWLKTGLTLSGSEPTPQHTYRLRRQLRAKVREMAVVLPLVFKHPDFAKIREEFEEAIINATRKGDAKGSKGKPPRKMDIDSVPPGVDWKDVDGKFSDKEEE